MKKILLVIIILIVAGLFLFKDKTVAPTNSEIEDIKETTEPVVSENIKEFAVDGNNFSFAPGTLTVNKGDTVKITFTNKLGMHDWKLDEFNVGTKVLKAGESEVVTFVADKTGTFEYYCSVGTHRQMGMVGKLIVN